MTIDRGKSMQYVLDSIGGRNGVQNFGSFMNITDLVSPSPVEPGTVFNISYTATNAATASLTAYGMLWDTVLNQEVIGTYWEAQIIAGGNKSVVVSFPDGISDAFFGEIRVGHIEGGCSEGARECINGYWNDCINGTWNPTTESCATPPTTAGGVIMLAGFGGILLLGLLMGRKKGERE